jgi:HlyD family secretion protein
MTPRSSWRRAPVLLLAVGTALGLAACGSAPPPPPQTARVARASISTGVDSAGSVSALGATNLGFPKGGRLTSVTVAVGQQVAPGDVLATIDDFAARQALRQAEANLAGQQAAYDKVADGTQVSGAQNSVDAAASVVSATQRQVDATLAADDAAITAAQRSAGAAGSAAGAAGASAATTMSRAQLAAARSACQDGDDSACAAMTGAASAATGIVTGTASSAAGAGAGTATTAAQTLAQAQQKRAADAATGQVQVATARQGQVTAQNGLDSASADRPNDLDAARAAVDAARAQVTQARQDLADTTLHAPSAGTITALNGAVGEYVAPSAATTPFAPGADAPIPGAAQAAGAAAGAAGAAGGAVSPTRPGGTQFLVLQNLAQFAVVAPFQEVDAAAIVPGQHAVVSVDAIPDHTLDGTVLSVAPSGTALGGSVEYYVTLALPQGDPRLHDGQSAHASVITAVSDQKISVPNTALHHEGARTTVTVLTPDGREVPTTVTTGLAGADRTEITSGLAEGQQVVVRGGS